MTANEAPSDLYVFGNGVRVRRADLIEEQLARYAAAGNPNLHEPAEERWLLEAFADDQPPEPVFVDVGAGIGYYSVLVKKRWPSARVVAVEPLPQHARALEATLTLNGLSDGDVTIVKCAVAARGGESFLFDRGYGSTIVGDHDAPRVRVRTQTLSALLAGIGRVHLLKMDIQGAEGDVLAAAHDLLQGKSVRNFLIGTHGAESHGRVRALLLGAGYEIACDDQAPPMQPDGIVLARA